MGRRTLLLLASILVAALGTALIWLYVQGAETRAEAGQALVPARFLTTDAGAGTPAETVLGSSVPKNVPASITADAVTSPQQVAGMVLKNPASSGQILLKSMFDATSSSGVANGRAYAAITILDPHRVPALLKPGDHVAVYALPTQGTKVSVTLVDPDATVKTIGNAQQPANNGQAAVPVTIVGFDATAKEAANLLAIETYGQPALILLGHGTTAQTPDLP